jgi:hypothetical protein
MAAIQMYWYFRHSTINRSRWDLAFLRTKRGTSAAHTNVTSSEWGLPKNLPKVVHANAKASIFVLTTNLTHCTRNHGHHWVAYKINLKKICQIVVTTNQQNHNVAKRFQSWKLPGVLRARTAYHENHSHFTLSDREHGQLWLRTGEPERHANISDSWRVHDKQHDSNLGRTNPTRKKPQYSAVINAKSD